MVESQSRYGIMQELNDKKVLVKKELATLEQQTDETVWNTENNIESAKKEIEQSDGSYELQFKQWKREKEVELRVQKQDADRMIKALQDTITERTANYKKDHAAWKKEMETKISTDESNLARYKTLQEKAISDKKEILGEVEKGINDLKEMSKETKTNE